MLANDHIHEEIKTIEDGIIAEKDVYKKCMMIGMKLIVKLLHNLRTNSVIAMKHQGIDLVKPKGRNDQSTTK